jgi:hypothetical protein
MQKLKAKNHRYNYLLTSVDVLRKLAWIIPGKTRSLAYDFEFVVLYDHAGKYISARPRYADILFLSFLSFVYPYR